MAVPRWISQRVVMPIASWRAKPGIAQQLETLERSQWYSRRELRDLQDERLRDLIRFAYEHVPYYRQVFKARRLAPKDFRSTEDLPKLPILTKTVIRQNFQELQAALRESLRSKLEHLRTTGRPIHPRAMRAAHWYLNQQTKGS